MKSQKNNGSNSVWMWIAILGILLCVIVGTQSPTRTIYSEENFIPVNPSCGDLHGPVWVDNSCWMDTSLIALFGPESTRSYFYQFLEKNSDDSSDLVKVKTSLRDMVDSMWNTLENFTDGAIDEVTDDGGGIGDRVSTKKDSQELRNTLKSLYQGSFHQEYREISGFVESGDLNYSHRFLSDLCYILGVPGLPLDKDVSRDTITYLLPPPDYESDKKDTYWNAFGKIEDWDKFTLQQPHPFLWYRCSFKNITSIPNDRLVKTKLGHGKIGEKGGTSHYTISAIVILAFQHYITYFRCGGRWFLYDGLMEEDPVISMDFEEFSSSLSRDKLYHATLSTSIFSRLDNNDTPKRIFDPRHAWIAPNGVDYEGDALCMYTLKKD